jgi:hypothetical protein
MIGDGQIQSVLVINALRRNTAYEALRAIPKKPSSAPLKGLVVQLLRGSNFRRPGNVRSKNDPSAESDYQ